MARLPRLSLPGWPHHVVWRGHHGAAVFLDAQDRLVFLTLLMEHARQHGVKLHAYTLLDSAVHLLLTPGDDRALSLTMQAVGRAYGRRFNVRHGRSGTLWEGRFRCTVVEPAEALLNCMVFVDTEAVVQGVAATPQAHAWSSHAHYVGQRTDAALVAPAPYWDLGNTPFAREAAYAERVAAGLDAAERRRLLDAALKGWAYGSPAFVQSLQTLTPRRLERGRVGRPRKSVT